MWRASFQPCCRTTILLCSNQATHALPSCSSRPIGRSPVVLAVIPRSFYCAVAVKPKVSSMETLSSADGTPQNDKGASKQLKEFWRKADVGGEEVHWNYRREIVQRRNLEKNVTYTSYSIVISVVVGVILFVWVKMQVLEDRKAEMAKREKLRRDKNLVGTAERRNISSI